MTPTDTHIGILSTGGYVPSSVITNADLSSMVKDFDPQRAGRSLNEWIQEHYGISERRWSDEMPSHQATQAAKIAIDNSGLKKEDIDFIILNTSFGDYPQPTTATAVQHNLGLRSDVFAVEINMPCAGPIYGLSMAYAMINMGKYRNGLVIGVDKMTELIDKEAFMLASLFGEGAGAAVVSRDKGHKILDFHLGSKGEVGEEQDYGLVIPAGKAKHPVSQRTLEEKLHYLHLRGGVVNEFVLGSIMDTVKELVVKQGLQPNDIPTVVPHQAGKNLIVKGLMKEGFKEEQLCFTLGKYGNTSAASILLTLDKFWNKPNAGEKVLLLGMGGGLNWGGVLLQW